MQGVKRGCVRLLPHDISWKTEYSETAALLTRLWGDNVLNIAHVGSTAIGSIAAKPILDVAVKVRDITKMDIAILQEHGYEYRGPQQGSDTYHLFVLRDENDYSLQHIHVYDQRDQQFEQLKSFVSYLNNHPDKAKEYNELKTALAAKYPADRPSYTRGKAEFILDIYRQMNK